MTNQKNGPFYNKDYKAWGYAHNGRRLTAKTDII